VRARDRRRPEYELLDTGVFADDRYFDVAVEYAKATVDDLLIRVAVTNRGAERPRCTSCRRCGSRNTWTWEPGSPRPRLRAGSSRVGGSVVEAETRRSAAWLVCEGTADLPLTENETNARRLWGAANPTMYVKDAFDDYVVHGRADAVNPARVGRRGAHFRLMLAPGRRAPSTCGSPTSRPRRSRWPRLRCAARAAAAEADEFYATVWTASCSEDARAVAAPGLCRDALEQAVLSPRR